MGLDLALGGLVLIMAIRGWFRGFVLQAIRLAGLVACVYAADPVCEQAKPRVLPYLPTIRPELVDRGLWWTSAILSYVVLVGLASLAVKLYRRKPFGLEESNRNDQMAGSLLGIAKGVIVAAFLVSGLQKHAIGYVKNVRWAEEQTRTSRVIVWNDRYQPADKIWSSPPVRYFVNHIKRKGLTVPSAAPAESPPVQTASRTPRLEWSSGLPNLDTTDVEPDVAEAIESAKVELRKARRPN